MDRGSKAQPSRRALEEDPYCCGSIVKLAVGTLFEFLPRRNDFQIYAGVKNMLKDRKAGTQTPCPDSVEPGELCRYQLKDL